MGQLNVMEQVEAFGEGLYNDPDFDTQVQAGWYDWFCDTTELAGKTRKLYLHVIEVLATKKMLGMDLKKVYVWFKNNCPMAGDLYDDIRFSDIETGENIIVIVPHSGHESDADAPASAHGTAFSNDGSFVHEAYIGTWKGLIHFLNQ